MLRKSFLFISLFIVGLLLTACGAQAKTYTIGVINPYPHFTTTLQGFKDGLAELGYVEGKNITYLHADTTPMDKLDAVAQEIVAAKVDLIFSTSTVSTKAVQKAMTGTDIPVVFSALADPVGAGLVNSLDQPGGNMTGLIVGAQDARRLEWFLQIKPTIKKVYVPYSPKDPASVASLKRVDEAAAKLGVELIKREVNNPEEVVTAFENIPEEAEAIFMTTDGLTGSRMADFLKAATDRKIPLSAGGADAAYDGVLVGYGPSQGHVGKQTARLADKILKGGKPADLPVETADPYLGINLKAAEAIGLDIPDEVLRQAEIVVRQ